MQSQNLKRGNFMRLKLDKLDVEVIIFFSVVVIVSAWLLATVTVMFKNAAG